MNNAVLEIGEKVHIITRRMFPEDLRRHFVGVVQAVSEDHIRAEGYVFVFNAGTNDFQRLSSKRVRLVSLSVGNIINIIPKDVDIDALRYQKIDGRLVVTDRNFALDINEFSATG
jgi:hypothetical protein